MEINYLKLNLLKLILHAFSTHQRFVTINDKEHNFSVVNFMFT